MICGFKQIFPWGEQTFFQEKILAGIDKKWRSQFTPKITTIRPGNRWKVGDKIHMAYGVRTKKYLQFNEDITELSTIKVVLPIKIDWYNIHVKPLPGFFDKGGSFKEPKIKIAGETFERGHSQMLRMYHNDGFENSDQFFKWFDKDFSGQLISWMDIKTDPLEWVHSTLKDGSL